MPISYASEDREAIAEPLAAALRRAGVKVWLDKQELTLGDSLSEKIDEGLSRSYFGVVILSKAFFGKHWPKKELAGLRTREDEGHKVILPVWHGVDKKDVREFSPILADALAVETNLGIEPVAFAILDVVFSPNSLSSNRPSLTRAMNNILDGDSDRRVMVNFLSASSNKLDHSNVFGRGQLSIYDKTIGGTTFDMVSMVSSGEMTYIFLHFSEFWKDPFDHSSSKSLTILKGIGDRLDKVKGSRRAFENDIKTIHPMLMQQQLERRQIYGADDENSDVYKRLLRSRPRAYFMIFCGRRNAIDRTDERKIAWGKLCEAYAAETEIRSYDTILDQLVANEGY